MLGNDVMTVLGNAKTPICFGGRAVYTGLEEEKGGDLSRSKNFNLN